MNLKDEYIHGGQNGVGLLRNITFNAASITLERAKPKADGSGWETTTVDIPTLSVNTTGNAASASKLTNTSAIGSLTNPVYFTAKGVPAACTYSLNATVPVGTANQILYYSAANTLATQSYTTLTSNLDVFTYHATTAASNKKGLVPAPTAGSGEQYLRSDGTWQTIATTDTNTKVTQTGGLTSAGNYELILSKSTNDTTETDTVNKTSRLTYNPNTYSFTNGGCTQQYDSTNKCIKFIFS